MQELALSLLTALALIFVIEGFLYAVFPRQMQAAMARLQEITPEQLRSAGIIAMILGVLLVGLLR